MRRVGLATCRDLADLWAGDRLLLEELRRRGYTCAPLVWDDERVDWRSWDLIVIRSCWDYHLKADRFLAWLERLGALPVPVLNPAEAVRWNMHKRYLLDVERAGGRIPPTRLVERGAPGTLRSHLEEPGWRDAVIKPAISSTGFSTRLIQGAPSEADERSFAETLASRDILLQAYVREVRDRGEWSFVFFGGRYSHAVLKRAAPGEFRVHIEWGGTVENVVPARGLIDQAQALIDAMKMRLPYARVDAADVEGALVVMELELIEPELFLDCHPGAASRLADAVLAG